MTVVTDPGDPRRVLVGTSSGLFESLDGGRLFMRHKDGTMATYVRKLYFSGEQQGLIWASVSGGTVASPNSGTSWIATFFDDYGPRADVRGIGLGPKTFVC